MRTPGGKVALVGMGLLLCTATALAQDQTGTQDQKKEQIYGSQLMTPQERASYQKRMQSAKTAQEREQIRAEHHKQMQARAKERGMTLPEEPPARGGGMGPGMGGPGMGGGGGMGPGGGGGRRY